MLLNGRWLSDLHINAAQQLLQKQFNDYGGLQSTLYQQKKSLRKLENCIQILHIHENHWAVITTIGCDSQVKKIRYYDSLYNDTTDNAEKIISKLIPTTPQLEVEIMKMTKQVGSNDCGLFAIAVATALAYNMDPTTLIFAQDKMRPQLADCFIKHKITEFPIKRKSRTSNPVLRTSTIYTCPICKMPEGGLVMVGCDHCDIWHHLQCVPQFDPDVEKWYCQACSDLPTQRRNMNLLIIL